MKYFIKTANKRNYVAYAKRYGDLLMGKTEKAMRTQIKEYGNTAVKKMDQLVRQFKRADDVENYINASKDVRRHSYVTRKNMSGMAKMHADENLKVLGTRVGTIGAVGLAAMGFSKAKEDKQE